MSRTLLPFTRDPSDPVERWKAAALRRITDRAGAALVPRVEIGLSLGFVLIGLLAGLPFGRGGPVSAVAGLALVVLVHELPGALLARRWGSSSSIVLDAGGGFTHRFGSELGWPRALVLNAAGPLANLVLAALGFEWACALSSPWATQVRIGALWQGAWGLAQLLPLVPFRTGSALAARLSPPKDAVLHAFSVKLLLLGALVVSKLFPAAFPVVVLAAVGAARDFVGLYRRSVDEKRGLFGEARRAEALIESGQTAQALWVARRALGRAGSPPLRARLWRATAWSAIGEGDPLLAHGALAALPAEELDVHLVASYLATCNRTDEAASLLERGRALGQRSPETTKLLLELLLRRGDLVRGRAVASEDATLLTGDEARLLAGSAFGAVGRA